MSKEAINFLDRTHGLWVNGEWVQSSSESFIDVIDPATGEVVSVISNASQEDLDSCVRVARNAFEGDAWREITPATRSLLLHKLADLIEENGEELAYLETLDNGMPLSISQSVAVTASVNCCRYYAGWADKINGTTVPISSMPGDYHAYTLKEPIGVVGLIVPWNFPLVMAIMKIAPALAAGCTCILKPAEDTSLTALRIGELAAQAGIPNGVINVITGYGSGVGVGIASHPDIDKVAFTGSTVTGKAVVRAASVNLKRVSLELGGKAPNIILPDADLDKAVPASAMGIFFNSGQICTAASRLYVHDDIYDDVIERLLAFVKTIEVGPGLNSSSVLGPLVSSKQQQQVMSYIAKGREEGADILVGGKTLGSKGFFVEPTVMSVSEQDVTVVQEEIFGPVLVVQRFSSVDQVVEMANDSKYGLSAYVWTNKLSDSHKIVKRLDAGVVGVNVAAAADWDLPLGGFKQSGWGRENGMEGLLNYLQTKSVVASLDE